MSVWHRRRQTRSAVVPGCLLCVMVILGCEESGSDVDPAEVARKAQKDDSTTLKVSPNDLREKLNAWQARFGVAGNDIVEVSLFQTGARSIEPLKGLPLKALDLGMTRVEDLSPVAGMKLETLELENTPVSDISVLKGMPLSILKMQNTNVKSFDVLQGMPLKQLNLLNLPFTNDDLKYIAEAPIETLWLTGTQVTDISSVPLNKLVSLDVGNTKVENLAPLSNATSLRRLTISESLVTDLTPLQGLRLERVVLTPDRIRAGMEVLREMKSLGYVQTDLRQEMTKDEFFKRYDLGVFKPQPQESAPSP